MSKENALELLIKSAEAAVAYDIAIQGCADDPDKMSSYCTAQGDDLDTLYFNWQQAARAGLEAIKVSSATTNKAAEEGGLPALPEEIEVGGEGWDFEDFKSQKTFSVDHMHEYARRAIAADRASRQVANKAEVAPSDSYKSGYADGMEEGAKLAFWGDKPSEKFPEGWPAEIWLNAGDDELGPFSEYDEVSWCSAPQGGSDIRYIREDLLATPPAITGASTARDQALEDAAEAIDAMNDASGDAAAYDNREQNLYELEREHAISSCAEKVRSLKGSVGASTVLTDERIDATMAKYSTCIAPGVYSLRSFEAEDDMRRFAREVAAQAGQVAVPGWISVDARLPDAGYCLATYRNQHGKLRIIRAKYARQFEIDAGEDAIDQGNCEYNEADDTFYLKAGWLECIDNWDDYSSIYVTEGEVTHWMPLPAAPSPAKESK